MTDVKVFCLNLKKLLLLMKKIFRYVFPLIVVLTFIFLVLINKNNLKPTDYLSFIMILLTYFYVLFTWEMLEKLNTESYLEKRPYLIADFESENSFLSFYIKNIGKTPAKNVVIKIIPDIKMFERTSINETIFKNKIQFFPPDKKVETLINSTSEFFKKELTEYELEIKYEDTFGEIFKEKIVLNLEHHKSQSYIVTKNISDVVKSLNEIKMILEKKKN